MVNIIRSRERGSSKSNWLDTKYSFSFASYYNPERVGFKSLRVLNEDIIKPNGGFPMHDHENFEIVTIILEGALAHEDSLGNKGLIKAGDVQRMSAGTGIEHSEVNPSERESVHLLQIWIEPKIKNIKPSYQQKSFTIKGLTKIVGQDKDALSINQDVTFYLAKIEKEKLKAKNSYLHVIEGKVRVGKDVLEKGDAAEILEETEVEAKEKVFFLLIEFENL